MKSSLGIVHFSKLTLSCSSSTDRLTLHCSEVLAATTVEGGWARKEAVRMIYRSTQGVCVYLWRAGMDRQKGGR